MRKLTTTLTVLLCTVALAATLQSPLFSDEPDAANRNRELAAKPATQATIFANSLLYKMLPFEEQ
ncbi:MAG: hypothetical protein ABGZ23_15400 [Fuerstiella sp.]